MVFTYLDTKMLKSVFRSSSLFRSTNPKPKLSILAFTVTSPCCSSISIQNLISPRFFCSATSTCKQNDHDYDLSNRKEQFDDFRKRFQEYEATKKKIQNICIDIDIIIKTLPLPEDYDQQLCQLYGSLTEIHDKFPDQYYRFYLGLISETQKNTVAELAYFHWLENEKLLTYDEVEEKLKFDIDIKDYLMGICLMTDKLPRYVVSKVTHGDNDCSRRVLNFLNDLKGGFDILEVNFGNQFDEIKNNLRKIQDICFEVDINMSNEVQVNSEVLRKLSIKYT